MKRDVEMSLRAKRSNLMLLTMTLIFVPFTLANKGCERASSFQHPPVEKGMECSSCHDDGRTKETRPKGHDLAWQQNHGKYIQRYGFKPDGNCTLCHTESHCTTCHQREKPRDHTEFWRLKGHGLAVGLDRSRCQTCHQGAESCERCHSQTTPLDHTASWGAPSNRHCLSCHFPLTSAGGQRCAVCHTGTPSHASAPTQPSNALHVAGANCATCHTPLRHPDNGMTCTICHSR